MILISPESIFSSHQYIDGSVRVHLRSLPEEIVNREKSPQSERQPAEGVT
jgi:hypothetical protein